MKTWMTIATASFLAAGLAVPAFAQQSSLYRPGARQDGVMTITSSLTVQTPLGADESAEAAQKTALRTFYRMAGESCSLVTETIATHCEVVRVTSRTNISERPQQGRRLILSGEIRMSARMKPATGKD